jgi:hypothetical protein
MGIMPTGERNPVVHQPEPAGAGEGRLGTGWRRGPRIQSTERDRRGSTATGDAGSLAHGLFPPPGGAGPSTALVLIGPH